MTIKKLDRHELPKSLPDPGYTRRQMMIPLFNVTLPSKDAVLRRKEREKATDYLPREWPFKVRV